ncbi:MAG: hypothetical protein IJ087_14785 [Eggerthellaceae bacterium]|nr:hypothetical protein [Eggerthellaceae bacterium]
MVGTTVTVLRPGGPVADRLGNEVPGEPSEELVHGVLVGSPTSDDMEAARPYGATLAFTLHFPKSYDAPLAGCTVVLPEPWASDGGYRVVGDPRPLMDANTPTRWNRPVMVEAAHG